METLRSDNLGNKVSLIDEVTRVSRYESGLLSVA